MNSPQQFLSPQFLPSDVPLLKQQVRSMIYGSEVLGSQLGGLILKASEAIGKKLALRDFGGLKLFAETYLTDIVTCIGIYGNSTDYRYRVIPSSNQEGSVLVAPTDAQDIRAQITDKEYSQFWQAFSNPVSSQVIEFNTDKQLYIRLRQLSVASDGFKVFPSINAQEYSEIVSAFAQEQLHGDQQSQALVLINHQPAGSLNYPWYRFLLDKCGLSASNSWGQFRVERILALFGTKAHNQQFSADQISHYSKLLRESQRKQRPFQESPKAQLKVDNPEQLNQNNTESMTPILSGLNTQQDSLQSLVMKVVARMSDEQLRQLVLPVGYVLDVAKQLRHH